jgi:hypothetical protein
LAIVFLSTALPTSMGLGAWRTRGYAQAFCLWGFLPAFGNHLVSRVLFFIGTPHEALARHLTDFSEARLDFGIAWLFALLMGCCGVLCEWFLRLGGGPPDNR